MFLSNKNKINSNDLFNQIEQLKDVIIDPESHVWKYFDDMNNEIDLEFENILDNFTDNGETNKDNYDYLKITWIDIANKIHRFKNKCLNRINSPGFDLSQYNEQIKTIENEFNLTINSKNLINLITKNQISFKKIKKLIDELNTNIYKFIFNNKTIMYINREKCNQYELINEFGSPKSNDYRDLIGRLIIIQDHYLNDFDYFNLFSR